MGGGALLKYMVTGATYNVKNRCQNIVNDVILMTFKQ